MHKLVIIPKRNIYIYQRTTSTWKDLDTYAKDVDLSKPAKLSINKLIMKSGDEIHFSQSMTQLQSTLEEKSNTFYGSK